MYESLRGINCSKYIPYWFFCSKGTHKKEVQEENCKRLRELPGEIVEYKAHDKSSNQIYLISLQSRYIISLYSISTLTSYFNQVSILWEQLSCSRIITTQSWSSGIWHCNSNIWIISYFNCQKYSHQVILVKNLNVDKELVNGSRGIVIGFVSKDEEDKEFYPLVQFANKRKKVIRFAF